MPRYVNLWEIDNSKMPTDPKERMALLKKMSDMTKKSLKDHPGTEWGAFVGGNKGFAISSSGATWQEMAAITMAFEPYIKSQVYQAVTIDEFDDVFKAMMEQK